MFSDVSESFAILTVDNVFLIVNLSRKSGIGILIQYVQNELSFAWMMVLHQQSLHLHKSSVPG